MFSWFCNKSNDSDQYFNQNVWYLSPAFRTDLEKWNFFQSTTEAASLSIALCRFLWGWLHIIYKILSRAFFDMLLLKILNSWLFFKASPKILCIFDVTWWWWAVLQEFWGEALEKITNSKFLEATYQKKLSRGVWNLYGVNLREIYIELSTTTRPQ